jgi:hypothetical protein
MNNKHTQMDGRSETKNYIFKSADISLLGFANAIFAVGTFALGESQRRG